MNKIYIINDDDEYEVTLDFTNNTFQYNQSIYTFHIESKNKIVINNEIYYTEDSYLYYQDMKLKEKIKKIYIIQNEWNDQVIMNLDKKILKRFKYNSEYGNFVLENDKLIIEWNYWGKEIFIKHDDYTYIKEDYINNLINNIVYNIPIHIFIHICMIENWEIIIQDQINTIKNSGLYDICEKIHIGLLGDINNIHKKIFQDDKFDILYIDSRIDLYETNTINFIKYFCSKLKDEIYILYIHTKGVRRAGNDNVILSWRKMMEYFLIEKYQYCIDNLSFYDTIGNNVINSYCYDMDKIAVNKNHTYHYSGNFWWSKKSYIDKLPFIEIDLSINAINTRYIAENWILSEYPNAVIGILFQDDTNTHPYHRYVFDYYKKIDVVVKTLSN